MELTSLPTESLYKFTAFAGLLILFSSTVYWYKVYSSLVARIIKLHTETRVASVKVKATHKRMERSSNKLDAFSIDMEKKVELTRALVNESMSVPEHDTEEHEELHRKMVEHTDDIDSLLSQLKDEIPRRESEVDALSKLSSDAEKTQIELEGKLELIQFEYKKIKILSVGVVIAFILGLLLTIYGFKNWYTLQLYIDQATVREALKK